VAGLAADLGAASSTCACCRTDGTLAYTGRALTASSAARSTGVGHGAEAVPPWVAAVALRRRWYVPSMERTCRTWRAAGRPATWASADGAALSVCSHAATPPSTASARPDRCSYVHTDTDSMSAVMRSGQRGGPNQHTWVAWAMTAVKILAATVSWNGRRAPRESASTTVSASAHASAGNRL
jgi:hypothetical protein